MPLVDLSIISVLGFSLAYRSRMFGKPVFGASEENHDVISVEFSVMYQLSVYQKFEFESECWIPTCQWFTNVYLNKRFVEI